MTSRSGGGRLLHATLVAGELARSVAFYGAALSELGIARVAEYPDEEEGDAPADAVGFGSGDDAQLWLVRGPVATTGAHLAFAAGSPVEVDGFWRAGLANGGHGRQAPRNWEIYRPGYYGAILADPDGNLVEAAFDADPGPPART